MAKRQSERLFDVEPAPEKPKLPVDPLEEMVGALTDPIIAFPSGWMETIPEKLKRDLPLHRLAHQMRCLKGEAQWDEACDLEALIYLYPASLEAPMGEQWTRIYLYLGTKYLGQSAPQDIREESLSDYDVSELRGLKRWLHKKKLEARKARRKAQKVDAEKPEERVETKVVQTAFDLTR